MVFPCKRAPFPDGAPPPHKPEKGETQRRRKNATRPDRKVAMPLRPSLAYHSLATASGQAPGGAPLPGMRLMGPARKKNNRLPEAVKRCIFIGVIRYFQ